MIVASMKYVIHLAYEIKKTNYYSGPLIVGGQTPKLSKAATYNSHTEAKVVADEISEAWFASVTEVSDRELFEARLKGI